MEKIIKIAQIVIDELDSFDKNFTPTEYKKSEHNIDSNSFTSSKNNPQIRNDESIGEVYYKEQATAKEPFVCCVKALVQESGCEPQERIYLFYANSNPNIKPFAQNAAFVDYNFEGGVGRVASLKVGDSEPFPYKKYNTKEIDRTITVLEKIDFTPVKEGIWDGSNSDIWCEGAIKSDFYESLRELLLHNKEKDLSRNELINEIEKAERNLEIKKQNKIKSKLKRQRAIISSISLKSKPTLDKFQDEFCRLPLKSTNLLIGSPGTGKTTTLIKRLRFKSTSKNININKLELGRDQLKNWVMFTPNELLKNYLKEAMNKEHLSATDDQVITWERERTVLGRDILKFLKTQDSGRFSRINENILLNNSSSKLIEYTKDFLDYFNQSTQKGFADAIDVLEQNKPKVEITTKEYFEIVENFESFTMDCKILFGRVKGRKISDDDYKTLYLIEGFQKLKPKLLNLRSQIRTQIDKILNQLIASNPEIIEKVSKIISERGNLNEQTDEIEITENSLELDDDDVEETDQEEIDLRVKAKRQIRQVIIKFAESLALKTKLKSKKQIIILEVISAFLNDQDTLELLGKINISLRLRIFGLLDYSKILNYFSICYDKFRLELLETKSPYFVENISELMKKKKISQNEIDVVIYSILQFAAKIFEENRDLLEKETNFDLLENIKARYKTQIAVDEAPDFSAIQLGCMYHLAHPKYKSVSFAGDLMQRVTGFGVSDWDECNFFSKRIERKELEISYRQTPVLLEIAGKLYENIIGQVPPFKSNYSDSVKNPEPLKFKTDINEDLGIWITNRISEIYKINGEALPSIAIFVPEENDIDFVYEAIQEQLNETSIDVEKCEKGRILGTGSAVRIFSVDYIKGLEFEGVFFINIDEMQEKSDDLLDKYLYVGLTRATTFLGITFKNQFPEKIKFIEDSFSETDWSEFI
jgi:DNA polymerase III delta prime subunit